MERTPKYNVGDVVILNGGGKARARIVNVIVIPAPPDLVIPRGVYLRSADPAPTEHTIVFKSLAPIHPIQYDVILCDMLKEGYSEDQATIRGVLEHWIFGPA